MAFANRASDASRMRIESNEKKFSLRQTRWLSPVISVLVFLLVGLMILGTVQSRHASGSRVIFPVVMLTFLAIVAGLTPGILAVEVDKDAGDVLVRRRSLFRNVLLAYPITDVVRVEIKGTRSVRTINWETANLVLKGGRRVAVIRLFRTNFGKEASPEMIAAVKSLAGYLHVPVA
jgi:hypothetical protein